MKDNNEPLNMIADFIKSQKKLAALNQVLKGIRDNILNSKPTSKKK